MTIEVTKHPPERGRSTVTLSCMGGCCCCCCCLHTAGSVAGALMAPAAGGTHHNAHDEARSIYWRSVGIVCLVILALCLLFSRSYVFFVAPFVLALFFPLVQLIASFAAFVKVRSGNEDRRLEDRDAVKAHLQSMALYSLYGGIAGILVMYLIARLLWLR